MHSLLLGRIASPARRIAQSFYTSSATLRSVRSKDFDVNRRAFPSLNVSKSLCSMQKGLLPSRSVQRRLTSSAILRCRLPALLQNSVSSHLSRTSMRERFPQMVKVRVFTYLAVVSRKDKTPAPITVGCVPTSKTDLPI